MKDVEVWRTANSMIRQYGAEAERCARHRAERLRQEGIPDGALDWDRIAAAIGELDRKSPGSGEKVN